jgi:hypothetical protein
MPLSTVAGSKDILIQKRHGKHNEHTTMGRVDYSRLDRLVETQRYIRKPDT